MSAAITAKTAKERATIAIRIMKYNKDPFTREMDNCLEMGDGDEVIKIIKERAKRDPVLMARVKVVFARHVWADMVNEHSCNPGRLVDPADESKGGYCVECGEVIR